MVALRALRSGAQPTRPARSSTGRWPSSRPPRRGAGGASAIDPGDDAADATRPGCAPDLQQRRRRDGRQVQLTYYVPARDEESERVVDPRGVVTADGTTYLDAWCHSAEDDRLFRLDRIHGRRGARRAGHPRPTRRRRTWRAASSARPRTPTAGDPGLQPRPAGSPSTTRSRRPGALPDGGLEVDLLVADERWLTRLLLRLAPHARRWSRPRACADAFTAQRTGAHSSLYAGDRRTMTRRPHRPT